MDNLKENVKAKKIKKKNKKSVKQKLDEKINMNDKIMEKYYEKIIKNATISLLNQGNKVDIEKLILTLETHQERGKNALVIGRNNFNKELLEWLHTNNKIINIEKIDENLALKMGFKYPKDTKRSIDSSAIKHILKRHGENSKLAKNSSMPIVNIEDISKYLDYIDNANEQIITTDRNNNKVLVSFKQINGHFIVVEQMRNKNNSLSLKTMFKEQGDYKNSKAYKESIKNKST
ncbi:hypothetical protein CQA69_07910 [Campylobacter estrildidarum]|uniref:Phage-Barnase-EndoU-ColicinE5/D-RelE like nuclease 3 domain-containing protein n=2 Tax=Campylobacter estrildidarum TaxID=2510189 RepID=A0A4U7BG25_9BACT|nr:hypothetical protein CQA69_07910 [Campylobacter estrildidarum]